MMTLRETGMPEHTQKDYKVHPEHQSAARSEGGKGMVIRYNILCVGKSAYLFRYFRCSVEGYLGVDMFQIKFRAALSVQRGTR